MRFAGAISIEQYDLRTNTWSRLDKLSARRLQFGVAVLDDRLYVVGGRDGLKTLNTVECFNPRNRFWSGMPSMSTRRHGLGMGACSYFYYLYFFFVFFTRSRLMEEQG